MTMKTLCPCLTPAVTRPRLIHAAVLWRSVELLFSTFPLPSLGMANNTVMYAMVTQAHLQVGLLPNKAAG